MKLPYMNCSKTILFSIFLTFSFIGINGQQSPVFSQYVMNGFLINPSLAGRDGYTTVSLTARDQWIGIKGSPTSFAASLQGAFLKKGKLFSKGKRRPSAPAKPTRVGLGGYLFNDNNGIIGRTGFQFSYAYHIPLAKNKLGQDDLSLGLSMVTYQHVLKTEDLQYSYNDDPYLSSYDRSVFITDFNFGASYTSTKYYIDFAMTNILRGSLIYGNDSGYKRGIQGNFFFTGGGNIPINRDWTLKPSAFLKFSDLVLSSMQLDLTTRIFYKDSYWAGLSYRTNNSIIVLLGLRYDKYYFGFAYDYTLTDIKQSTIGSMEFTIAAKFGESSRRYSWLNAF